MIGATKVFVDIKQSKLAIRQHFGFKIILRRAELTYCESGKHDKRHVPLRLSFEFSLTSFSSHLTWVLAFLSGSWTKIKFQSLMCCEFANRAEGTVKYLEQPGCCV